VKSLNVANFATWRGHISPYLSELKSVQDARDAELKKEIVET